MRQAARRNGSAPSRLWAAAVLTAGLATLLSGAPVRAQDVTDDLSPHSEILLHAESEWIEPGKPFTAALRLTMDPGWHTYWVNGGDSGFPLGVLWDLPDGFTAGPLQWPAPGLQPLEPLMSYGYEDELVVLIDITPPASLPTGGAVVLRGAADWLVCADVCLPAQGEVELPLDVRSGTAPPDVRTGSIVADARARLPQPLDGSVRGAWFADGGYVLEFEAPEGVDFAAPYFFPEEMYWIEHAAPQRALDVGGAIRLWSQQSEFADEVAGELRGLLVADLGSGESAAYSLSVALQPAPESVPAADNPVASAAAVVTGGFAASGAFAQGFGGAADAAGVGLLLALALAFAGGVLLNLMPCVFPVLSLKVLGFVERGGESPASARTHGLAFGAGVLLSFWALAAVLIALRAGGASLGWGFQLQSPAVVASIALVVFALGLSLSGVFDLGLSLTRLGGAGAGGGYGDSFASGGLAVVVATPCTAPFMGSALGYALVQPAAVGMGVFTALAAGLAAPYVFLSFRPGLIARLPRPGAWMESLKQVLAFPLYATVVWLVWVFARQAGVDAAAVLLLGMTMLAFAAWLWGRTAMGPHRLARSAAVALAVAAFVVSIQGGRALRPGADPASNAIAWEVFSPEAVAVHRAAGRPVLVDFTAAWCLSCQVNERVALRSPSALRAFDEANVALIKADWTSRDSVITRTLQSFGRSGVPLYVLYPANRSAPPELLPALLTPGIVVDAVNRAAAVAGAGY